MFYKTAFIFIALLCLTNARPQESPPIEDQDAMEDLNTALGSFFDDLWKTIESIWAPLKDLLETLPEDDETDDIIRNFDPSDVLKNFENHIQDNENETDGELSDENIPVLPIPSPETAE